METKEKLQTVLDEGKCLYNLADINRALDNMAVAMTEELHDKNPLILCVMTGAMIPAAHLIMRLSFPLEIDYIHVTRYRGTTRGGDLHWLVEPRQNLRDRTVLIFDDIMDGGLTLQAIVDYCKQAKAKQIYSGVMVSKIRSREDGVHFEPDFVALTAENKYLVGFGLDYHEYLRNVPGIYAINDEND